MAGALSVDFAGARPDPNAIKAAGYVAVWRYMSGDAWKDITAAEAETYLAAGLGIGLIWETTGTRALAGASAGTADGTAAVAQARSVGAPAGTPVLCNIGDFAATGSQIEQIAAYYAAFTAVVGAEGYSHGGYATGFIIDALAGRGYLGIWWQNAMNDAGTPGSTVSPHASVYQRTTPTLTIAGTPASDFDEDVIVVPVPFWGWSPPTPAPVPVHLEEDDVPAFVTCNNSIYIIGNDLSVVGVSTPADGTALQQAFGITEAKLPAITPAQLAALQARG